MIRAATLFLAALVLSSCMAVGTRVDESQLTHFERGRTSYYDVVATLGKPNAATLFADGSREVVYSYSQQQLKVENFIPIVAMFAQGSTTETTTVTLMFDAQDRLVTYTATQGSMVVGTGLASGAKQ